MGTLALRVGTRAGEWLVRNSRRGRARSGMRRITAGGRGRLGAAPASASPAATSGATGCGSRACVARRCGQQVVIISRFSMGWFRFERRGGGGRNMPGLSGRRCVLRVGIGAWWPPGWLAIGVSCNGGRACRRAALRRRRLPKGIGSAVKLCGEGAATKELEAGFLARGADVAVVVLGKVPHDPSDMHGCSSR